MIYLLSCKRCRKQYVGSSVRKFRFRLKRYKSNIKMCGEGQRGFKQEKLIKHFFCSNYNGIYQDIPVHIIYHCHQYDQERWHDFWIQKKLLGHN